MCVILVCEEKKPTRSLLDAAARANGHGAGVGWIEGKGTVCWEKGVTPARLMEIVDRARLPLVVHFRIASVGGISQELTHPFPVTAEANALSGRMRGGSVVFHNGHWSGWKDALLRSLTADGKAQLPSGVWSDSRAMALLAHRHGVNVLKLIESTQRIAVLSREGIMRLGNTWTYADGIWLSNTNGLTLALGGQAPQQQRYDLRRESLAGHLGGRTTFGGGPFKQSTFLTREAEMLDRALETGGVVDDEDEQAQCGWDGVEYGWSGEETVDDGEPEAVDVAMEKRRKR